MKITLLGAGGFVGSHLVEHLIARDEHEIIGVDTTDEKLQGIQGSNFRFHEADIRTADELLERLACESDLVVDLVAYANPSLYVTSPLEVFDLNFLQNLKIADLCVKHRTRLIQYSSAEVYGKISSGTHFSEDETDFVIGPVGKHRWIYSAAKALLERVLHAHGLQGDLEYTIIRPFNFIGSRIDYLVGPGTMGGPRVFAHFMSALLTGGPIQLVDGGEVHRAFLHIDDANEAFQTLLDHPEETRNQIYNVGNPESNLAIRDLAFLMIELYEEITGQACNSPIHDVAGESFYGEGYEDADRLPPDIRKLGALGWKPQRDIRTTFRDAMLYYVQRSDLRTSV